MADPGLIAMVREKWPEVAIHLSVQANTVNWAAVKFWQKVGVTRMILSRELSLDEIETKNKFSIGDTIEIIHPSGNRMVKLTQMKDKDGASIDVAAGSPTHVWIPVDGPAEGGLLARML